MELSELAILTSPIRGVGNEHHQRFRFRLFVRSHGQDNRCNWSSRCLAFGGFPVAVTGAGAALSAQPSDAISVNHANKGDRLPLAFKRTPSASSPTVSTYSRQPIGCKSAFSRAAEPARAHIFGRCIS